MIPVEVGRQLFEPEVPDYDLLIPLISRAEVLFFLLFSGLLTPLIGVVAQVYHYRTDATALERQQLRLIVWALVLSFGTALLFLFLIIWLNLSQESGFSREALAQIEALVFRVASPPFVVIPIVLLIAILKYRLFDIDVFINRTLVYGTVGLILTVAESLVNLALEQSLPALAIAG